MILWNNTKKVRYSLLLAGWKLDTDKIQRCLKDGIKVYWFGSKEDNDILRTVFNDYIDKYFLYVYENTENIHHFIIDGAFDGNEYIVLESLERGDQGFNLQQYIIEHDGTSPLVVVQAGAGSGKTFVMLNRLMYLLHTIDDFRFSDVVMVTFTNEATDNMRKKLIELLNTKLQLTGNIGYLKWIEEVSQISISTIHSFFRRVIIEIGPLLGYGTDLKMESMILEKRAILMDILDQRYGNSIDYVSNVLGLSVYDIERLAMQFWEKIENKGMSGSDVFSMEWGSTSTPEATRLQDTLRQIFEEIEDRYDERKLEKNSIAMGDIIHEFSRVVNDPRLKEYLTSRYKYIFCDEFQDSDDVQIQTIAVLDKLYDGNLFVVGDIKQSIYRFRGATDSAFERLDSNILQAFGPDHVTEPYSLSKNYRTSESILVKLDKIFREWGDKGFLKYKYIGDNNDVLMSQVDIPGIYKQILVYRKKELETKFNALIDRLKRSFGKKKKTIMVLTRSNWQLQEVKQWCEAAKRPCLIRESGGFFRSPAVLEFCALVEAFLYHNEPMYLFNLLRTAYCFSAVDLERFEELNGSKDEITESLMKLIRENCCWDEFLEAFRNRPVMSVLCSIIDSIKPSIVYYAIQKQKYLQNGYDTENGTEQAILDAKQYEADLQKLLQMLSTSFLGDFTSLYDIAEYIRSRINTDSQEESAVVPNDGDIIYIQGSTVHSAKGLEFDNVVIPFMNDLFVKNDRTEILIDKETGRIGWSYIKTKGGPVIHNDQYTELNEKERIEVIGDETRLLYVAMTRAIEGLYCFTWPRRNSGMPQNWSDLLPGRMDDANYL